MSAKDRTDSKLRFAELMLRELKEPADIEGDDFQRAHEEAFFFHLHGARDAYLYEIKEHHKLTLGRKKVTVEVLCKALRGGCPGTEQLDEIVNLENNRNHPLHRLKEWRDVSTHRGGVTRHFFLGGSENYSDSAFN